MTTSKCWNCGIEEMFTHCERTAFLVIEMVCVFKGK
jgi:hypothetical protein